MMAWLYRYVFKGIGLLFVAGMLTNLYLSVASQMQLRQSPKQSPSRQAQQAPAATVRKAH